MTIRPGPPVALIAVALLVLAGLGYLVSSASSSRAPLLVVSPPPVAAPPPVGAPVAAARAAPVVGVPQIDAGWLRRTAEQSGVPAVALQAYARAELRAPSSCRLGWTTLAGIGWVESEHGTIGGRTLGVDGRSSSPVLGPALDGTDGFRAIPATSATTLLHGDPRWDHAVGPLQFIPSTWAAWAADGDGDGVEDPNDIDDAALAAADYLCADGRDLSTAEGWTGAVLSYNHAGAYVDAVHAAATTYAARTS